MKKNLLFISLSILVGCNSNQPASTEPAKPAADSVVAQEIHSPYDVRYSSKFMTGNPKNAENVLTLWKDYDNGTLSAHKDLFADTVAVLLGSGARMRGPRDSIVAGVQAYRSSMANAVDFVDAVTALKSTDKNEDWVLVWGTEVDTHKDGKIDSVALQETWRLNKDSKVDLILQYMRPAAPPKKMK
jgi:hypothetical protein